MPASTRPASRPSRAAPMTATSCAGRKIWTTTAQEADKILLLTRTAKKEDGKKPTDGMTLFYTDARPRQGRGAPHPEDGPRRGGFERGVHRRSVRAGRGPHRRGGQGLPLSARQPQSRTHSDRRRSDRPRPRCAEPRGAVMRANASCSAAPSARTRASSIRSPKLGVSRKRLVDVPARRVALRFETALRRRSQRREIPRRPRRVRRLHAQR